MDKQKYLNKLEQLYSSSGMSEEDIANAKLYADNLIGLGLPVIMNQEHFAALIGINVDSLSFILQAIESHFYHEMTIPKKTGGMRRILAPAKSLKYIQQWILRNILCKMPVSQYATGFCKNKSIVSNAAIHVNKKCVLNMDLKDFFPSIDRKQIYRIFYYYGFTAQVAFMLSRLCTYQDKLPQGAPTSPYLSNIVCLRLDKRLSLLAEKYESSYSRYADDITVSSNSNIKNIIPVITKIVEDEGFSVNTKKTRIAFDYQRQEVTGLIVNNGTVSVPRKYKKKLLQEIYYCKKYGVEDHLKHIQCKKLFYQDHMYGKAYFLYMVEPTLGKHVLDLLDSINWEC